MEKIIYLDNAATTKVKPEVVSQMLPFFSENYSNPSAYYGFATKTMAKVNVARNEIATLIGAKPEEIFFTSGGSESDNWAIIEAAMSFSDKGKHIITTSIEHHAVLHTCDYLKEQGFEVTVLKVNGDGTVDPTEVKEAIRKDTVLISVMMANNEIGTLQPIEEIGKIARENNICFHTDAVQAFGHIEVDVERLNIDLLSASAHKLGGPKGVGCLYIRQGIRLRSFIHGGAQERGRRAGTLNVPGIIGFSAAAKLARENMSKNHEYVYGLREHMLDRILNEIPYVYLNGDRYNRLPGNINISIDYVEGEAVLILLDMAGVCASSGSACTSGSLDASHVLRAIGLSDRLAKGSVRITINEDNTPQEIDEAVDILKNIIEKLRKNNREYLKMTGEA